MLFAHRSVSSITPPSAVPPLISDLNGRISQTINILNSSALPDDFLEAYPGHRRLDPVRTPEGFRWRVLEQMNHPDPIIHSKAFGISQRAATPNTPGCWPRRHTWHSEEMVIGLGKISRKRETGDFQFM